MSAGAQRRAAYRQIKADRGDPVALVAAALSADERQRRYLRRRVLGPVLGKAAAFDAIDVGLTLSDPARRADHLTRVRDAIQHGDDLALRDLIDAAIWWSMPDGYELVRPFIGAGKTSRVGLVRRIEDGAEFAWKIPESDSAASTRALLEVAARAREWVRLGANPDPALVAPDGRTVLQRYVDGVTLHGLLQGIPRSPQQSTLAEERDTLISTAPGVALAAMFASMARGGAFVSGLNPKNLIYDGDRWHVIDSGSVQRTANVAEAFALQRRSALLQWTRWTPGAAGEAAGVFQVVRRQLNLGWSAPLQAQWVRMHRVVLRRRRERV